MNATFANKRVYNTNCRKLKNIYDIILTGNNNMASTRKLPTSQTPGRMGTSFGRSVFGDCLGGQALVMIG